MISVSLRLAAFLAIAPLAAVALAQETNAAIFRHGDEVIVQIDRLDRLRQEHKRLPAVVRLTGDGGERSLAVDFADPLISGALVIDCAGFGECRAVALEVKDASGTTLLAARASPLPTIDLARDLPEQAGRFAAIERGSQLDPAPAPRIALPDGTALRTLTLAGAARSVKSSAIAYPVVADVDLPGSGSSNYVIVSRQSFAPEDPTRCSLYFSYRKPLFEAGSTQLKEWRKLLVEVPLDKAWLGKSGDETITLPLDGFKIHTTEERERAGKRWNAPQGYNMLGGSSTGLFQGGQTADVDEQGRIYITNVPDGAGIVRFNPHTGDFEQPPVNFLAEAGKFLPTSGDWKRSWDADLAQVVCTCGRVFIVFDRHYRVSTPNGNYETCSGVVSVPQENWGDAEAFRRDVRLHAGCWPDAAFPLYDREGQPNETRRAGPPVATRHGIAFGTHRLDLDAAGNTVRLAVVKNLGDAVDAVGRPLPPTEIETVRGLRKQRLINVGGAGRPFIRQSYGEFGVSRAALALIFPDAPPELLAEPDGRYRSTFPGAPAGELTVR
ncbi:MAG TPA: hypothetical protein VGE52_04180, partial [Pirellulales bacterium]